MWKVYRIEMPATTREQYIERGTDETRGYARSLIVIGDDACIEVAACGDRDEAERCARLEYDSTGRPCIVRELTADSNERRW